MNTTKKIGIILANLGTPDAPQPAAISRYLWEFLTDPRVVDLSALEMVSPFKSHYFTYAF